MQKIPKREYTAELQERVVKRVKDGKSVGAVAKEMGLVEQTLRNWVKQFDACRLNGAGAAKVTPEQNPLVSVDQQVAGQRGTLLTRFTMRFHGASNALRSPRKRLRYWAGVTPTLRRNRRPKKAASS
jgi:transposase